MINSLPIVSIVGRPNVGKSSLFNRMLGRRLAVVHDTAGVTRDRNYQPLTWENRTFTLVDTGGMIPDSKKLMERLIFEQVERAISESKLVLFVVDAQTGITNTDEEVARYLKKNFRHGTLVIANKAESPSSLHQLHEFRRLGLGEAIPVSASHGTNVADLLDEVAKQVGVLEQEQTAPARREIRIAIIGRPNAGKSSLVNKLCAEQRVVVDEQPGTTRDSIDVHIENDGQRYVIMDTAGMRKKARVHDEIEYFSNLRVSKSIERCDVAVILIDAEDGLGEQDQRVLHMAARCGKGIILVLNKWDKVEKESKLFDKTSEMINGMNPDFKNIPKLSISALTGLRVNRVLSTAREVFDRCGFRVNQEELHAFTEGFFSTNPPQSTGRYPVRVHSVVQEGIYPPTFIVLCDDPKRVRDSYIRFFRNRILDHYSFLGCTVRVLWKTKVKRKKRNASHS